MGRATVSLVALAVIEAFLLWPQSGSGTVQTASNHTHFPEIKGAMLVLAASAALLTALALARPAAAEEVVVADQTVKVPENQAGDGRVDTDTGVDVQTGDRIVVNDTPLRDLILARGVIYPAGRALAAFWPPTGPAGYSSTSCTANSTYPLSSAPCFGLLGKLNDQYFYIGHSKEWVHQGGADRLRLIANDDSPGNGEGYFEVRIQVFRDIPLPDTTITSSPSGLVNTNSVAFGFSSERGVTFQCKLDGGAFESCSSPKGYVGLPDGQHTFYVRAIDQYGRPDPIPDQRTWTVDTVAPDSTIDSGTSGIVKSASASFAYSSETGATFECKLDSADFEPCASPKSYTALLNGSHIFSVRAKDAAGNLDESPASRTWTVDTLKPTVSGMSPKPATTTSDTTPTIKATVKDNFTNLQKANIKLYLNGESISSTKYSYSASTDLLTYNSPRLSKGKKNV